MMEIVIKIRGYEGAEGPYDITISDATLEMYHDICEQWSKSRRIDGIMMVELSKKRYPEDGVIAVPATDIHCIYVKDAHEDPEPEKAEYVDAGTIYIEPENRDYEEVIL